MPRIRVRTLMIAVAMVALIFGRSAYLGNRERDHRREAATIKLGDLELYLLLTAPGPGGLMHPDSGHPIVPASAPIRSFIRYHHEMARKYAQAARQPWLPVAADPPAPPRPSEAKVKRYFAILNSL